MANLFNPKDRRVLPNWRSFSLTTGLGELDGLKKGVNVSSRPDLSIEDYVFSWDRNKQITIAGDLLSAAFVNGLTEDPKVKEAAVFVLSNREKSTDNLLKFAEYIINPTDEAIDKRVTFHFEDGYDEIKKMIREIKDKINNYPQNPILYVELSRLYSILGNKEKAIKNMSIAIQLAPENRFVLRAASRLYTHFGLADHIHHIIKKSEISKYDPWIISAEIALATILDRSSHLIKKGFQMIKFGKYVPRDLTELAASLGTLEFLHGNRKKTNKMLKASMISPNDNSLAQVEWISNKGYNFIINPNDYRIENKYEALTLDNYYDNKFDEALKNSIAWFCDIPFSRSPIIFSSYIAGSILDKNELAINILFAGLESHPNDPQIINNLAFALALENRLDDAEKHLGKIVNLSNVDQIASVCLTATKGLVAFRRGNKTKGRKLYSESIEKTEEIKNNYLKGLAMLNYVREEILSNSDDNLINNLMEQVDKIQIDKMFPDAIKLKNVIIELYKKRKNKT